MSDPAPKRAPLLSSRTLIIAAVALAVVLAFAVGRGTAVEPRLPSASSSHVEVRPTPNVLLAMRDLSRLETESYHMERVVELSDEQTKLYGLLRARDALLLIAVGDVVAGVDLGKLGDADVIVDWPKRSVRVTLPPAEVLSVAIDNAKTHVFSRNTDFIATRKEELEGLARADAEKSMRAAALDEAILAHARTGAERTLRTLLRTLGFESVELAWKAP
jgi:hypothetical protein